MYFADFFSLEGVETFPFRGLQNGGDVFLSLKLECIWRACIVDKQYNKVPICGRVERT